MFLVWTRGNEWMIKVICEETSKEDIIVSFNHLGKLQKN